MQERDRFANALLRDELRRLNTHLPKNRRTISELLSDPSPSVPSVSGHNIRMKRTELEEIRASLPGESLDRVRLPIVLLRNRELGTGGFTLLGDPYEEYSILLLSGDFKGTFEEFKNMNPRAITIYKPQVSQLLRRFHSLIVIGFGSAGVEQNPLR